MGSESVSLAAEARELEGLNMLDLCARIIASVENWHCCIMWY